ncbi:GDP-D-glucose phosphorylase 1 [Armadillidium nasatum]|uniref:GDP-D-glucose phosphorylase 1 n=1 Tax=Armadillidium nasatum TaxID=96803 RepID=A0A5N5TDN6_9CRUS|nr:GDP-D-glucose phosphorylase 1 [Armadillidium nasatum]
MEPTFILNEKDFIWFTGVNHSNDDNSEFDKIYKRSWRKAESSNIMNYKVDEEILKTKVLPGYFKLVAQFNPMRVMNRRKPEEIVSIKQPFDSQKFNFTQIHDGEILFEIFLKCGSENEENQLTCTVVVNSAPITPFHGLLIPARFNCRPQILNVDGIRIAIAIVLASKTPALKVAFNSLGGMASVNHYHFHIYYLHHPLFIETAVCEHLVGPLYAFKDLYAPGFVFQLDRSDIGTTAKNAIILSNYLLEKEICHNVMITRGIPAQQEEQRELPVYDTVRVCFWLRKPSFGIKEIIGFAAAVCELSGHIPVYDDETWENLTEEEVVRSIKDVCLESYNKHLEDIKQLFS